MTGLCRLMLFHLQFYSLFLVDHCLYFCPFTVICHAIYGYQLPAWYYQTIYMHCQTRIKFLFTSFINLPPPPPPLPSTLFMMLFYLFTNSSLQLNVHVQWVFFFTKYNFFSFDFSGFSITHGFSWFSLLQKSGYRTTNNDISYFT